MKIEFDLKNEKDVEYLMEVFKKFAGHHPKLKIVPTPHPSYNMLYPNQQLMTEDGFVAALQYIALTKN